MMVDLKAAFGPRPAEGMVDWPRAAAAMLATVADADVRVGLRELYEDAEDELVVHHAVDEGQRLAYQRLRRRMGAQ